MSMGTSGISGFAGYLPPCRVSLEDRCAWWTGNAWEEMGAVIGNGFRMVGPDQNVYTMAGEAALRLLLEHEVDPQVVGYVALGTESNTDNATSGAIVVRGLIDAALAARGLPTLARDLEKASATGADLQGEDILPIGDGSGDASEVLVATAAAGWRVAAAKSGMTAALRDPVDLDALEYAALHVGTAAGVPSREGVGFAIDRVGDIDTPCLQDTGIEYHHYREEGVPSART